MVFFFSKIQGWLDMEKFYNICFCCIFKSIFYTLRINGAIEVSHCMPQKLFKRFNPNLDVKPEALFNCFKALRPYHGLLLLKEQNEILDLLPLDYQTTLKKLVLYASPTKSLRTIASDSDLALTHVSLFFY